MFFAILFIKYTWNKINSTRKYFTSRPQNNIRKNFVGRIKKKSPSLFMFTCSALYSTCVFIYIYIHTATANVGVVLRNLCVMY